MPLKSLFDAVVFDLDGTLLDSLEDIAAASNAVLASQGFPQHPTDAYRQFVGSGVRVLFERCLPKAACDEPTLARCVEGFRVEYARQWNRHTRPYEGIPHLLTALAERCLPMSVLSNKPHAFTVQCVEELLGDWNFAVVFGQREGCPRKPDPAAALEIAEELGIPVERFVYVGDTAVDMETATAAGMLPVGVTWGFRTRDELLRSGAAQVIDHPQDLLGIIFPAEFGADRHPSPRCRPGDV